MKVRLLAAVFFFFFAAASGEEKIVFLVTIDYDKSAEEIMAAGKYDWVDGGVNSANFPPKQKGMAKIAVELLHFGWRISTPEAISKMEEMGYRPAELYEIAFLGKQHPDVQREFFIAALGSEWRDKKRNRFVPVLCALRGERHFRLSWGGGGWDGFFRFAAVKKL